MNTYGNLDIVESEVIVITPEIAQSLLGKNKSNRGIKNSLITSYANDMLSDNWRLTHQGIAINELGELVDGQHRLLAIIKSNKPIKMMVTKYKGDISALLCPLDLQAKRTTCDITGYSINVSQVLGFIVRDILQRGNARVDSMVIQLHNKLEKYMPWIDENISTTCAKVFSAAPVKAAVFCGYLAGFDWSGEYGKLVLLKLDSVSKSTYSLWKKLNQYQDQTSGPVFRRIAFGSTFAAITEPNTDYAIFRDALISKKISEAKTIINTLTNTIDPLGRVFDIFGRQVKTY